MSVIMKSCYEIWSIDSFEIPAKNILKKFKLQLLLNNNYLKSVWIQMYNLGQHSGVVGSFAALQFQGLQFNLGYWFGVLHAGVGLLMVHWFPPTVQNPADMWTGYA